MRVNVEIGYKVTLTDKKGNYERLMEQIHTEEGLRGKVNTKKIEKYFGMGNALVIPLPNGEKIKVYIAG